METPVTSIENLSANERSIISSHHLGQASYWEQCESTQRRLALDAKPDEEMIFTANPLVGEKRTPENWLKRAEIFREWKTQSIERAALFAPLEKK